MSLRILDDNNATIVCKQSPHNDRQDIAIAKAHINRVEQLIPITRVKHHLQAGCFLIGYLYSTSAQNFGEPLSNIRYKIRSLVRECIQETLPFGSNTIRWQRVITKRIIYRPKSTCGDISNTFQLLQDADVRG